jgi:hypothetical protein
LAAVTYQSGFPIDEFLATIAVTLRADNYRLAGVIQQNRHQQDAGNADICCAAMTLVDLATGKRFEISQNLGPESQGCRLDAGGLVQVGGFLDLAVGHSQDLLILNKFGRAEAEGGGLRSVIARALDEGVPVLTAVGPLYSEAWREFHGGFAIDLAPDSEVVLAWCHSTVNSHRAARAAIA